MALTERNRPYETLIRHNDDGSIGAHHVTISEVLRDGAVITATTNPPVAVEGEALALVLGSDLVAALGDNTRLRGVVELQQRQIADGQQQLAAAAESGAKLQARLDATLNENASLRAALDQLQQQLAQVTATSKATAAEAAPAPV